MTPMMVDVEKRTVVIIGGGRVAFKRAKLLIDHGAYVTIISPEIIDELAQLHNCGQLAWKNEKFDPADLRGAFVVVIATNDHNENERVAAAASEVPLLNRADGGEGGNLHIPGYVSRGKLTLAVSTGGASPMLASRIKKRLEKEFPPDYGNYVDFLYECRYHLKQSNLSKEVQHSFLQRMLEEAYQDPTLQQQLLMEIHRAREEKAFDRTKK